MAYTNKTYICFDADTDMHRYNLMKAWKENEKFAFNFHNAHDLNILRSTSSEEAIKRKLRERLLNTKVMIVLVGEKTKFLYKFVRWEIEYAIENNIPLIIVNLNDKRIMDLSLCPPLLRNELAMHISSGHKIINYALNNWPASHYRQRVLKKTGPFTYKQIVYTELYGK